MALIAVEVLGVWCVVAVITGLALGSAIRRGECIHKEEFLSCLFSAIEAWQGSR
ncbi:MAG: hypothetical protein ACRD4Y_05125 [Candidatus Acidiferrales bacterium]